MRNLKDIVQSTFKFAKCFNYEQHVGTFEDMAEVFSEGKYWFGPWWDHVDEYTALTNIHVIHYEALLKVSRFFC